MTPKINYFAYLQLGKNDASFAHQVFASARCWLNSINRIKLPLASNTRGHVTSTTSPSNNAALDVRELAWSWVRSRITLPNSCPMQLVFDSFSQHQLILVAIYSERHRSKLTHIASQGNHWLRMLQYTSRANQWLSCTSETMSSLSP